MPLQYKEDWDEAKERYQAWWAHESIGRCAMAVTAPREGCPPLTWPERPPTPEQCWTDLDYLSAVNTYWFESIYYGGEAFPTWHGGYPGHTTFAVFYGCPITLDFETGWIDPILTGESIDYGQLRINREHPYYQFAVKQLQRASQESLGKAIPAIGAFGGCGDTLAWLRGSEQLLYDVADRPEEVHAAEMLLMEQWIEEYSRFYELIRDAAEGSTCWFSLWSPGKMYAAQNDFAYMISPCDFNRIFLPAIELQTQFLDHCVYHVDGEGNFNHVDALCTLPRLHALQILPGDGKPSPLHYLPVLKKVQAAGKNLHITLSPHEVETALTELSARGLFIKTHCESEDEAKTLLKNAERWSRDRVMVGKA